jgi:hypothetical protein
MPQPYQYTQEQVLHMLTLIQCPMLLLWPRKGTGWPYDQEVVDKKMDVLRKCNKSGLMVIQWIEGATGHHCHLDQAELFVAPIADFLNKIADRERAIAQGVSDAIIKSKL